MYIIYIYIGAVSDVNLITKLWKLTPILIHLIHKPFTPQNNAYSVQIVSVFLFFWSKHVTI